MNNESLENQNLNNEQTTTSNNVEALNSQPIENLEEPTTFKFGSFTNSKVDQLEETPVNQEQIHPQSEVLQTELDPLNNANNPIPVNPTSPKIEKKDYSNIDLKLKDIFSNISKYIFKPSTTTNEMVENYQYIGNAVKITLIFTIISIVANLISTSVFSIISRGYNIANESYHISFNFANMFNHDWLTLLSLSFLSSFVLIIITSIIYYLYSFVTNKKILFGKTLMTSNMSFLYLNLGLSILYPIGNILSPFIGLLLIFITLILSLLLFYSTINKTMVFNNENQSLVTHTLLIGLSFFIIICLIYIYYNSIIMS